MGITMSNEMIERVAKAMRNSAFNKKEHTEWDDLGKSVKDFYRTMAKAAIEAMREPTEEMVRAVKAHPDFLGYGDDEFDWIFKVMIEAALK
jgi:hypothetical protein